MHASDCIYYHPSAMFSFYPATPSILMEMQKKKKKNSYRMHKAHSADKYGYGFHLQGHCSRSDRISKKQCKKRSSRSPKAGCEDNQNITVLSILTRNHFCSVQNEAMVQRELPFPLVGAFCFSAPKPKGNHRLITI